MFVEGVGDGQRGAVPARGVLGKAIYQASSLLAQDIDRLEVIGSQIHVRAGGQRVVFQATHSQTYDWESKTPTLGGTSGEVALISGPESSATGLFGLLKLLRFRK